MGQLHLATDSAIDREAWLAEFFANLDRCTDKSSVTHGLHPYPAKFIPHIPRELIRAYSEPGEQVWDPMCGSGTALVEAALDGRDAFGTDINPVAVLAARAKTTALSAEEGASVRRLIGKLTSDAMDWQAGKADPETAPPDFHNRDHWFEPHVAVELAHARAQIGRLTSPRASELALCAFSALIVAVSNQESETRWRAVPTDIPVGLVLARLARKLEATLSGVEEFGRLATGVAAARCQDARNSGLPPESVHLVVTSPPYANSHDYYLYNKLRLFWLGYDVAAVQTTEIGSRNRHSDRGEGIETYLDGIGGVLREVRRVLVPGGVAAIVVGDAVIRGEFFSMDNLIPPVAQSAGLELESHFSFDHRRFNTAFQSGFGTRAQKATHVLVFRTA